MGREAQALLRVRVEDNDLAEHVKRLTAVKDLWRDMAGLGEGLKDIVPQIALTRLANLNASLEGKLPANLKVFVKEVGALRAEATPLATAMAKMAAAFAQLAPGLLSISLHGKDAARAFRDLAKSFKASEIQQMQAAARAINAGSRAMDKMGKAGGKAAVGLDAYVDSVRGAKAEGVLLTHSINQTTQAAERKTKQVHALRAAYNRLVSTSESVKRTQQNIIRNAALLFIAYHWARGLTTQLRLAAQEMDLKNTLTQSIEGFTEKMNAANRALQGTVTNLSVMKSMALMSSFGIPLENFAAQMEMVAKMAIRTGQSSEYLAESLARGVSRLSPMILDNLGLQISLSKSYETYAASVGLSSSALNEAQKKQAVMNEVIRQSNDLVKDVDIGAAYSTQVEQASVLMEEFAADIRKWVLTAIATSFQSADQATRSYLNSLKALRKEMKETGASTGEVDRLQDFAERFPGVVSKGGMLLKNIHIGVRELLGQESRMMTMTEKQISQEIRYKEQQLERIKLSKALMDIDADRQRLANEADLNPKGPSVQYQTPAQEANAKQARRERLEAMREYGLMLADQRRGLMADLVLQEKRGAAGQKTAARIKEEIDEINSSMERLQKGLAALDTGFALMLGRTQAKGIRDYLTVEKEAYESTKARLEMEVRIKGSMASRLALEAFLNDYAKQRLDREELIAKSADAILNGTFDRKKVEIDLEAISRKALVSATIKAIVFNRTMKAEKAHIAAVTDLTIYQQRLLEGTTEETVRNAQEKAKLNTMQEKFNEMLGKSIALGTENASVTTKEIVMAGRALAIQQRKVMIAEEDNKYVVRGIEALKDKNLLSKAEQQIEFNRLSNGRSLAEVQARMAVVRKEEMKVQQQLAKVEKARLDVILLMPWAADLAVRAQQGMTQEIEANLKKLRDEAGRLDEIIKAAPSRTGGGGGRAKKEKLFEELLGDPTTTVQLVRDGMNIIVQTMETQSRQLLEKVVQGKNPDGSDDILFRLVAGDTKVISKKVQSLLSQTYADMSRYRQVAATTLQKDARGATVDETFGRLLFGGALGDVRVQVNAYMQKLRADLKAAVGDDKLTSFITGSLSRAEQDVAIVERFAAGLRDTGLAASAFGQGAKDAQDALQRLIGTQNDLLTTAARPSDAEVIFSKLMFGVNVEEMRERLLAEIESFQKMVTDARASDAFADTTIIERMMGDKQRTLEDLEFYMGTLKTAEKGLTEFSEAFRMGLAGGEDLIGEDVAAALDSISESALQLGKALSSANISEYDLFTAAIPAMRGFFHEFVKDRKARAGIEAAMNAAAAWAAYPNVPQMIAHGTAATMYGLIAGGAVRLPTAASSARKRDTAGSNSGPVHLHYYGDPVSTEADRGVLVDRMVAEARAEGRFA